MKLVDMTVGGYTGLLASDAPAPGGGSASALCGAQGAALVGMVAALTLGKKKYADEQALCEGVAAEAAVLRAELLAQVDRDTEAFERVSAAFKLPKESDAEKAARKAAIADATLGATRVPFETMRLALEGLRLARQLVGHSNANAASDLGVAALNLGACVKGAWLNVLINLGGLADEGDFRREGEAVVAEADALEREVYGAVKAAL